MPKKIDIKSKPLNEMENDFLYSFIGPEDGNIKLYEEEITDDENVDFVTYGCMHPVRGRNMWLFWKEVSNKNTGDVVRVAWEMPSSDEEHLKALIREQNFENLEE